MMATKLETAPILHLLIHLWTELSLDRVLPFRKRREKRRSRKLRIRLARRSERTVIPVSRRPIPVPSGSWKHQCALHIARISMSVCLTDSSGLNFLSNYGVCLSDVL
uniref:Uncharacterized protein n=1 Tax=Opuntia streptacantha TaxID=393608 RepID=A0A7C9AX69_OPUST